jgi:pimeloyl-ACP methyl ester carboxylesterase
VSAQFFKDHAHAMVLNGFAVLRYDPPGIGRSTGESGFESLNSRTDEAVAAVQFLQSRSDIQPEKVGLWGISQGGWVIAMAAAGSPQDVAFIIPVSGSGVSVAEQQVYSIEAHSKAAGFSEEDIAKAVLFGRLLVDWQLVDPIFREDNVPEAEALGDGPWTSFLELVYEPGEITPAEGLQIGIDILKSIQDEPWVEFLYLKELYIPTLESIPPEQAAALKEVVGPTLLNDPEEYMPNVQSPVLAIFGEDDLLQPSEISAGLYEQYLTEAGNTNFKIVVIPDEGHESVVRAPRYWEEIFNWLDNLYSE